MKRLFLFPIYDPGQIINPYLVELAEAVKRHFLVVNDGDPIKYGIIQILRYRRKIDVVYLNLREVPC